MTQSPVTQSRESKAVVDSEPEKVERISPRTTIAVLVSVALFLYVIREILLPFIVAGVLAYVTTPLVERFARWLRAPRWAGATLVFLLLIGLVAGLGYLFFPPFERQFAQIASNLPHVLQVAAHRLVGNGSVRFLGQEMNASEIATRLTDLVKGMMNQGQALTVGLYVMSGFFGSILTLVMLFYFLVSGPQIGSGLLALVPPKQRGPAHLMWSELDPILRRYFVGVIIVVAYASTAAYIGLGLVLGIHDAALLALLTGLLEMIPVVGPMLSAVIAGLVALQGATSVWNIFGYAIYAILLRLSIDQVLGPIVLGRAARVHPVLIIFCFLAGGLLFNISGMVLAIPIAITIKVILATLYRDTQDLPPASKAAVREHGQSR